MLTRSRPLLAGALLLALALVLLLHWDTFVSIVRKWTGDSAFSHGLLIVPISLWLCWRKRESVAAAEWGADWLGIVALLGLGVVWFLARATGVLVVEQFAVVAMVPATVLAVLGRSVARELAFPLLFLLLAVPMGRGIVPWLMQNTADIAAAALRLTGVPVVREGMILRIPGGDFEVARACSGLSYLVTGFTLGVLYAYLTYTSWRKRLVFMAASIVVPMVLNGIRAYLVILIAHLTDMRWGTGPEHVTFGRVLFLATMLFLFWIGARWRDPAEPAVRRTIESGSARPRIGRAEGLAVLAALVAIVAPAMHLETAVGHARADLEAQRIHLPAGAAGWSGPREDSLVWRPVYAGFIAEQAATYDSGPVGQVEVYVAVYGLGTSGPGEMITYGNRLSSVESESLLPQRNLAIDLPGGPLDVREILVPTVLGPRLVWRWYMVGDEVHRSDTKVKAAELAAFLAGGDASERVVILSSLAGRDPDAARARLEAFAANHEACVRTGFADAACAP